MKLLIINGPNINMLGIREPGIYGRASYTELLNMIEDHAARRGVRCETFQSNHEGEIVDRIQAAYFDGTDGIVINPAAYTHTSVAIADAISAVSLPTVEVHISDPDSREPFRHTSYLRDIAVLTVKGHGLDGYTEAMDYLINTYGHES